VTVVIIDADSVPVPYVVLPVGDRLLTGEAGHHIGQGEWGRDQVGYITDDLLHVGIQQHPGTGALSLASFSLPHSGKTNKKYHAAKRNGSWTWTCTVHPPSEWDRRTDRSTALFPYHRAGAKWACYKVPIQHFLFFDTMCYFSYVPRNVCLQKGDNLTLVATLLIIRQSKNKKIYIINFIFSIVMFVSRKRLSTCLVLSRNISTTTRWRNCCFPKPSLSLPNRQRSE